MFRDWGFLLGEIWVLVLIAALLGVLAGWLIWGRGDGDDVTDEVESLESDLATCQRNGKAKDQQIVELRSQLQTAQSQATTDDTPPEPAPVVAPLATVLAADATATVDGDKPVTLTAARDGVADDLKKIKGVGPKMETMLHSLGFYHFDQVASWTPEQVAWVDDNLEGFKGRVSRDNWVDQAKLIANGGETEFSQKVDKGEMY